MVLGGVWEGGGGAGILDFEKWRKIYTRGGNPNPISESDHIFRPKKESESRI